MTPSTPLTSRPWRRYPGTTSRLATRTEAHKAIRRCADGPHRATRPRSWARRTCTTASWSSSKRAALPTIRARSPATRWHSGWFTTTSPRCSVIRTWRRRWRPPNSPRATSLLRALGAIHARDHLGRRLRHPPATHHHGNQQAIVAGVRQTDGLLPAVHPDDGRYPRHLGDHHPARRGG